MTAGGRSAAGGRVLVSCEDFPNWQEQREECCARIALAPATLKILLKTRNESYFLERWIRHHRAIAGDGNIVIFDNMSDRPEVLDLYEKYRDVCEIIRFGGFHNLIHDTRAYPELYRALARSAEFFVFLDTDEFLVMIDQAGHYSDSRVVKFLRDNHRADVFPATSLDNCPWQAARAHCGTEFTHLAGCLAWSKPVLRSDAQLTGLVNHTAQLAPSLFATPVRTNLFVLHMTKLLPQQRIEANVNKLLARNFARPGETAQALAERSLDGVDDPNTVTYVMELQRLLSAQPYEDSADAPLRPGCLELGHGNAIRYFSEAERNQIEALLANPQDWLERARAVAASGN